MKKLIRVVPLIVTIVFFMNVASFMIGMKIKETPKAVIASKVQSHNVIVAPIPTAGEFKSLSDNRGLITAQKYYDWYLSCKKHYFRSPSGNSSKDDCPYDSSPYVSEKLIQRLNSTNISLFDPFFCSQQIPESVDIENSEKNNSVFLLEYFENSSKKIEVNLNQENDSFKISDVICEGV